MVFKKKVLGRSEVKDSNLEYEKEIPLMDKVEILNKLALGETFHSVALYYHVQESTVKTLKNNESGIRAALSKSVLLTVKEESSNSSNNLLNRVTLEMKPLSNVDVAEAIDTNTQQNMIKSPKKNTRKKVKKMKIIVHSPKEDPVSKRLRRMDNCKELPSPLVKPTKSAASDTHCDTVPKSTCITKSMPIHDQSSLLNEPTSSKDRKDTSSHNFPASSILIGIEKIMEGANLLKKIDNGSDLTLQLAKDFESALSPYTNICKDILKSKSKKM